mgnify:CR=1 FL=1
MRSFISRDDECFFIIVKLIVLENRLKIKFIVDNASVWNRVPNVRAQISQGLLRHTQERIIKVASILLPYEQPGIALVGLGFSEIFKQIETLSKHAYLFDAFIVGNQQVIDKNKFNFTTL